MKKNAFTIPELLIIIGLIGVVSVLMLTVIKPNEKYIGYAYYNAYNVLEVAGYNIYQDAVDAMQKVNNGDNTIPAADRSFPANDPKELCKKLAINPKLSSSNAAEKYGYINSTVYNCNSASFKTVSVTTAASQDALFTDANLAFSATNSMKFYISPKETIYVYNSATGNNDTVSYYVVWVDINGSRRPNSVLMKKGRVPDIVAFAMTLSGKIIPLGYPTTDTKFMQARLVYPTYTKQTYSTMIYSYYQAQAAAFQGNEYFGDIMSIGKAMRTQYSSKSLNIDSKYIPANPTADSNCVIPSGALMSTCSIEVVEKKGL